MRLEQLEWNRMKVIHTVDGLINGGGGGGGAYIHVSGWACY